MKYVQVTNQPRAVLEELGCRAWDESGLMLLPAKLLSKLAPGTELTSIVGRKVVVGRDEIDADTRGGLLAFGVFPSEAN